MADNETNYNEILYDFEINEDTVGSSHDADGNLISQRIYEEYDDDTFHAVCDIPCYPTGLFLHIDISGLRYRTEYKHPSTITTLVREDFRIDYRPLSGILKVFGGKQINSAKQEIDVTDALNLNIQYIGGSCVPKTYCANEEKIFGYHDFKGKKIDDYDLKKKGYVGDFKQYDYSKTLSGEGSGTIPSRADETTVWIDCPGGDGTNPDVSFSSIDSISQIVYTGYTLKKSSQQIGLNFSSQWLTFDPQNFTFEYQIIYSTNNICNELKNIRQLIFMDPNLLCFTTRAVNGNQTDEDMVRYPMYKVKDVDDKHQAIYLLNTKGLEGTYDFLSVTGKSYTYTKDNQYYEGFNYGYMANAPQGNLFNEDGEAVTIKKGPVNDGVVNILSIADNNSSSYYNKTSPAFNASLVSRYGIQGTATKAMIQDSPFAKDQENNTKGLMEDEKTNLLYQKTKYSDKHPLVVYSNNNPETIIKGATKLLDQFHFLCQDQVYRIPLNGDTTVCLKQTSIYNIYTETSGTDATDAPAFLSIANDPQNGSSVILNLSHSKLMSFSGRGDTTPIYKGKSCNGKYQMSIPVCVVPGSRSSGEGGDPIYYVSFPLLNSDRSDIRLNQYGSVDYRFMSDGVLINNHNNNLPVFVNLPFGGVISDVAEESEENYIIKLKTNPFITDELTKKEVEGEEGDGTRLSQGGHVSHLTKCPNNTVGLCYKSSYYGTQHMDWLSQTDFFSYVYCGNTISLPGYSLNLSGKQGDNIVLNNNILTTTLKNQYNRTITTSTILTSNVLDDFGPTDTFATASYNAIPLIPLKCTSETLDEGEIGQDRITHKTYKFFFNHFRDGGYGGSFGCDAYFQLFNQQKHPTIFFYVAAYPMDKSTTLVEKEKIFESEEYSSVNNGTEIPYEQDTGFTINDSVYDLTARTPNDGPRFEGSVELVDNKYVIKGNLVFYGGGGSSGTATITLKYKIYE